MVVVDYRCFFEQLTKPWRAGRISDFNVVVYVGIYSMASLQDTLNRLARNSSGQSSFERQAELYTLRSFSRAAAGREGVMKCLAEDAQDRAYASKVLERKYGCSTKEAEDLVRLFGEDKGSDAGNALAAIFSPGEKGALVVRLKRAKEAVRGYEEWRAALKSSELFRRYSANPVSYEEATKILAELNAPRNKSVLFDDADDTSDESAPDALVAGTSIFICEARPEAELERDVPAAHVRASKVLLEAVEKVIAFRDEKASSAFCAMAIEQYAFLDRWAAFQFRRMFQGRILHMGLGSDSMVPFSEQISELANVVGLLSKEERESFLLLRLEGESFVEDAKAAQKAISKLHAAGVKPFEITRVLRDTAPAERFDLLLKLSEKHSLLDYSPTIRRASSRKGEAFAEFALERAGVVVDGSSPTRTVGEMIRPCLGNPRLERILGYLSDEGFDAFLDPRYFRGVSAFLKPELKLPEALTAFQAYREFVDSGQEAKARAVERLASMTVSQGDVLNIISGLRVSSIGEVELALKQEQDPMFLRCLNQLGSARPVKSPSGSTQGETLKGCTKPVAQDLMILDLARLGIGAEVVARTRGILGETLGHRIRGVWRGAPSVFASFASHVERFGNYRTFRSILKDRDAFARYLQVLQESRTGGVGSGGEQDGMCRVEEFLRGPSGRYDHAGLLRLLFPVSEEVVAHKLETDVMDLTELSQMGFPFRRVHIIGGFYVDEPKKVDALRKTLKETTGHDIPVCVSQEPEDIGVCALDLVVWIPAQNRHTPFYAMQKTCASVDAHMVVSTHLNEKLVAQTIIEAAQEEIRRSASQ